jgi:hypothetical protein
VNRNEVTRQQQSAQQLRQLAAQRSRVERAGAAPAGGLHLPAASAATRATVGPRGAPSGPPPAVRGQQNRLVSPGPVPGSRNAGPLAGAARGVQPGAVGRSFSAPASPTPHVQSPVIHNGTPRSVQQPVIHNGIPRSGQSPVIHNGAPAPSVQQPVIHNGFSHYTPPSVSHYNPPAAPHYSAPAYHAPAAHYSAPAYHAPAQHFSAPAYHAPVPHFSAPVHHAPAPAYHAPASHGGNGHHK